MLREQILALFGKKLRQRILELNPDFENIQEIRVRAEKPLIFMENGKEYFLQGEVSLEDIQEIVPNSFGQTYDAVLVNGVTVPISRSKTQALREALQNQGVRFL